MVFNARKRGIIKFPGLSANYGTFTIDNAPKDCVDNNDTLPENAVPIDEKLEGHVNTHYDALTDEQRINNFRNPFPKIKSAKDYKTSLEKAIGCIDDVWLGVPFEEVKDKHGRIQIESAGMFWSPDFFYGRMYEAARKLTLLTLSSQFTKDKSYLTVFNKFSDKVDICLNSIVNLLPQDYKDLWRAEVSLLNIYCVEDGPLPKERSSDKYELEFLGALRVARKYVEDYKEFLSMPAEIKQKVLAAYNEKEQGAGLAIAKYLLELAQSGNNNQKATYKQLKANVRQELSSLREVMANLGTDAINEFDAQIKRYKAGFRKAS